jgi:Fe2+ transport system protein B
MILEKNEFIIDAIKTKDKVCFQKIENILKNNAHQNFPMLIETKRAEFIEKIIKNCIVNLPNNGYIKISRRNNHKIDKYVYKKFIGVPLLILLMCMIYYASFGPYMGGGLQKLLNENLFQELIRKNLNSLFNNLN